MLLCSPNVCMSWTNNRKRFSCDPFPLKQYQKDHTALIILVIEPENTRTIEASSNTYGIDEHFVFAIIAAITLHHKIQLAYVRLSCVPALSPGLEFQKPTRLFASQLGDRQTGSLQSVVWCEHAVLVGNGNSSVFPACSRALEAARI